MNLYKKIDRLQKQVDQLSIENSELKQKMKDNEREMADCDAKIKAAEEAENEYYKLITEAKQYRDEYKNMQKELAKIIKTAENRYNKVLKAM